MATSHYQLSLLLLFLLLTMSAATSGSPETPREPEVTSIIDALIGTGDFRSWANIISAVDFADFPVSATLFVPSDDSISGGILTTTAGDRILDPYTIPYHIVPKRLTFSDLRLLKPFSRLPTLLPAMSILLTNTSLSNFTLDDTLLSQPDLYLSSSIALHGLASLLDYSIYGAAHGRAPFRSLPPPPSWDFSVVDVGDRTSDGGCLCRELPVVLKWVMIFLFSCICLVV